MEQLPISRAHVDMLRTILPTTGYHHTFPIAAHDAISSTMKFTKCEGEHMKNRKVRKLVVGMVFIAEALFLAGCANHLVFGTNTTLGLDVSGTAQVPDKVTLAYDRTEVAIVPKNTNGVARSVYGAIDYDVSLSKQVIRQNFGTGNAAKNLAGKTNHYTNTPQKTSKSDRPVYFTTSTKLGIDVGLMQAEQIKPTLLLGFKRAEAAIIPVAPSDAQAASVYADISVVSDISPWKKNDTNTAITKYYENQTATLVTNQTLPITGGVRIKQVFATGEAAVIASGQPNVQKKVNQAMGMDYKEAVVKKITREETLKDIRTGLKSIKAEKRPAVLSHAQNHFPNGQANYPTYSDLGNKIGTLNESDERLSAFNEWLKIQQ